jgi:hypothetical protein
MNETNIAYDAGCSFDNYLYNPPQSDVEVNCFIMCEKEIISKLKTLKYSKIKIFALQS